MNKILRYITLVGIFIIPFIPLIFASSLFFPFITGKGFTFRIVIEIVFAAWLVLALTDKSYRPQRSWIFYSLVIFTVIICLADAFGVYPYKSFWSNYERMEGWITLAHLLAYFVVASTVLNREKLWDALFQTSFGVNAVVIIYTLLQIGHLLTINQGDTRTDATFGNATYLAIYALFHIFIALVYLVRPKERRTSFNNWFFPIGYNAGFFFLVFPGILQIMNQADQAAQAQGLSSTGPAILGWTLLLWLLGNIIFFVTQYTKQERILFGFLVVFDLIVMYSTATRGAILGFIGGIVLAGILIAVFDRQHPIYRKVAWGAIIVSVVVVVGFLAVRNKPFVTNNPVLSRFASISPTERTTISRFLLWKMAFQGFKARPILGWGQENFNYVFNKYYDPKLYNQEQWFDRTHDVIFDWLIAGGILGLASYLFFFGSVVYYIWRARGEGEFSVSERALLTGMLAAYFIHNLFVFDNLTSYLLFITVAAYVYNRTSLRPVRASHPVKNTVILPVAAIALVVALYSLNLRPFLANRALITAISIPAQPTDLSPYNAAFKTALAYNTFGDPEIREQIMATADRFSGTQTQIKGLDELINLAVTEGKKQIDRTPNDARYYVFYGTLLARFGNTKDAITYLTKGLELSPSKQSIIFALAGTYLNTGDYKDAEIWLKKAYEMEPSYDAARMAYAASAIYNNDLALSDKLLATTSPSVIAASNDIAQALIATKQYGRLIELFKIKIVQEPTTQNYVYLASAYLYAGDRKHAISTLQDAETKDPSFKAQAESFIKDIQAGKIP
jgi:O-antigen ligase/Tfp pilus assembly protein PilF